MPLSYDSFAEFEQFEQEILREIIRDGETEMRARLDTANAADVRILTLVGFQLTIAIAMASAAYSLLSRNSPELELGGLAIFTVLGMILAANFGLKSATPTLFHFPGNDPKNWHHSQWYHELSHAGEATVKMALTEQCYTLHRALNENLVTMENAAWNAKFSIKSMYYTIFVAGVTSSVVLILRQTQ